MRDLHSTLSRVVALAAAARNSDATSAAIDLQGYDSAVIQIDIGVGGITFDATNKIEFKVTHSDDDSTYTDVTTADMVGVTVSGTGIVRALVAAHAAGAVYNYGYKGDKRYLKIQADFSGTHGSATPCAASVLRGHPRYAPTA